MRTILITGANRGLGLELAAQLLHSCAETHLLLACRSPEAFEAARAQLAERLQRGDLPLSFVQLDLLSRESVEAAADAVKQRDVKLDVLVNNAGVLTREIHPTVGHDDITINFTNTRHFTDLLLHNDVFCENFRIINVSAMVGNIRIIKIEELKRPFIEAKLETLNDVAENWIKLIDEQQQIEESIDREEAIVPAFSISKLLLNIYTRHLSKDEGFVSKKGVVIAVHPGVVKTDMCGSHAPLEVGEGAKPMFELIKMTDDELHKLSGKFLNRHLEVIDVLDEDIDFIKHRI